MLFAGVDESGKLKGILTLDELFQQKKEQCKALKQRIASAPSDELSAELKVRESQLEALSAKLKAKAISDEKKLLRAFKSIDTDGSGSLGRVELEAALATLQLDVAKTDGLFDALGGKEGEGITFEQFKGAIKLGGGKSFEKALATQIMHDGEVVSWATIEETFKKRTAQIQEIEAQLKESPDDEALQAKLKKRKTQCDAIAVRRRIRCWVAYKSSGSFAVSIVSHLPIHFCYILRKKSLPK